MIRCSALLLACGVYGFALQVRYSGGETTGGLLVLAIASIINGFLMMGYLLLWFRMRRRGWRPRLCSLSRPEYLRLLARRFPRREMCETLPGFDPDGDEVQNLAEMVSRLAPGGDYAPPEW